MVTSVIKSFQLIIKSVKTSNGRVVIIKAEIETETFILLNLCNSNSKTEQLQTLSDVDLFNQIIEATGENPILKKKSISKVLRITAEKYDLMDIWRVRNPSSTRFTFRKNHFSGFIQRRLDYMFISKSVQEFVKNIDVLASFCSDHSSLLLSHKKFLIKT